ncbi:MAG TPA: DUF1848 domain-containing protein [Azospirillaceae bacterium]|nr:DUF1848 domain-containing protein [Azospirillaceae bacterium]
MIVSASYRTDIPAFYADWFLARLRAGHCRVANPYGGPPGRVDLTPGAVDGFVFWTRNLAPFAAALDAVDALALPFVVQMTVTGYPRALDRSTIDAATAVDQMRTVRDRWGPRAAVWRYDPIVLSDATGADWHLANFAALAASLAGTVDEVVVSFLEPYRKTTRNMDAAARRHGFVWHRPDVAAQRGLTVRLAAVAAEHGMALAVCTQRQLADLPGVAAARCVDAGRLSDVAGRPLAARTKGNRPGCLCAESRDIGAYDTCIHGCAYCYAVASREAAQRRHGAHDPSGEALLPA